MSPPLVKPLRLLDTGLLGGTWHVVATTLSFWRGRRDPRITYGTLPDGRWLDTVEYRTAAGQDKRILGYDTPQAGEPGVFVWRGAGWLAWCKSRWCFVDADPDAGWAVTWFSAATLHVTPQGWDIYCRSPEVDAATIAGWLDSVEARLGHRSREDWFLTRRGMRQDGARPLR